MNRPEMESGVRKWLEGEEGRKVIDRVAHSVAKHVYSKHLSPVYLAKDPFGEYPPEDLIEDIRSELALFIAEHSAALSRVLTGGLANPVPYLKKAFIHHWIERTRTAKADPRRSFYKRVQDVLRNAGEFRLLAEPKKPLRYSAVAQSRPIQHLCEEDLGEIPFPADLTPEHGVINTKGALLRLARHLWEHVSTMWGSTPVWVEVRDLVTWIQLHVELWQPEIRKEDGNGRPSIDQMRDESGVPDRLPWDRDTILGWAGLFANRLTRKEQDVFRLYYGGGLTLKEVARELHYRGSSGPEYLLEKVCGKLRLFLRDLPWLSPDDLDQEALSFFVESLLAILEKTARAPYERSGTTRSVAMGKKVDEEL